MSLTRRLERRGADPTQPWGDSSPPPPGAFLRGPGGVVVDEQGALRVMTVYTCMAVLADSVSTLPLDAFTRKDAQTRIELDPAPAVVTDPWSEVIRQDWVAQVMYSLVMRGNFYGYIAERDRIGTPTQVQPLHPDQVRVRRNSDTGLREYRVNGTLIDLDDMWHVPGITMPGQVTGLNPIEFIRGGLGLALAAERYGAAFFDNSAQASVAITVPGELDGDEVLVLAKSWEAAHQGVGNAHLPAVLTGGATLTPISINPDDAQFLQTRDFQKMEIAGWFRIPPHMIGAVDKTTSWGTGIEQMEIGFVVNTLRPWLTRIEEMLTRLLPDKQYVKFNLAGRLRGDTLQRFQAYALARSGGWMNIDDVRVREDMAPLPNGLGQDYLQPLNFTPVGTAPASELPAGSDERAFNPVDYFNPAVAAYLVDHGINLSSEEAA